MKRYLLVLVLTLIGAASQAQGLGATDDGLDLVVLSMDLDGPAMASMEMKQELSLTEEQLRQVAQLNMSRYQQLQRAEANFTNDLLSRSREFRNIQFDNDQNLKGILSPQQLRSYQKLEGRLDLHLITENEE
ncbi:hypothetical protein [uncultured Pontibacter sp.]|uniref:hypothetical protein n=1 Tax=uncultured Pontibacter sp. TaxID=453356 RepID=UPI0026354A06|nr:hypothetical protein [uncultured Pontibacter sp.]